MKSVEASDPREVGPYRVLARLGRGGMGQVFLGSAPDGRLVALKLIHAQFAEEEEFRARFRREVDVSLAVSGAYTAAVVDADPEAANPWLASVFVPGPSLQEALAGIGELSADSALRLAAGLASALIQIHRVGLVHRDLKPSNILLTENGPVVIDFGIARAFSEAKDLTRTGGLIGTPEFMSPEQANGERVSPASDMFSFGSVVVAACTGSSPFAHVSTRETLNRVVRADADLSGVPADFRRFIEPCLDKNPERRPTAEQLRELVGPIGASLRAWPDPVRELITRQQSEIARLIVPSQAQPDPGTARIASLADPNASHTFADRPPAVRETAAGHSAAPPGTGSPGRAFPGTASPETRRRLVIGGVVATALAVMAAVILFVVLRPPSSRNRPVTGSSVTHLRATTPAAPNRSPTASPSANQQAGAPSKSRPRTDGLYVGDVDGSVRTYVRFSPDGTVYEASVVATADPDDVRQWLGTRGRPGEEGPWRYDTEGAFTTRSNDGTVDFTVRNFHGDHFDLHSVSHITGYSGTTHMAFSAD